MSETSTGCSVRFNESNQEVAIAGALRPRDPAAASEVTQAITAALARVSGTLYLNLKRLEHLNHVGFIALARALRDGLEAHPGLQVKVVTASALPALERRFTRLAEHLAGVQVKVYDQDFYPGQGVIENDQFIPVLRRQTHILWQHERALLEAHGLRRGMAVADVCCGIGDFAALVHKHFAPERMVAIDHSRPFLAYARQVAQEFGFGEIDYRFGDAASLLIDDDTFDFVTCRLSLQIFDRPDEIIRELMRVTRPGGRVYLTNEHVSHIHGHPRDAAIRWSYEETTRLFAALGMDLAFGPKMRAHLDDCGFEDLRVDLMTITNLNAPPEDFARVVESWADYILSEMGAACELDDAARQRMRQGFEDHVYAIKHRRGFGLWPIYVASGRKPRA